MSFTPSPPFLSHPMFVFVDSLRAHYHLTESASSHSAWMDPINVLTVQKYFSWLCCNLWAHIHDPTSECILVQPCRILPFCFITGDERKAGDLLLLQEQWIMRCHLIPYLSWSPHWSLSNDCGRTVCGRRRRSSTRMQSSSGENSRQPHHGAGLCLPGMVHAHRTPAHPRQMPAQCQPH